MLDSLQRSLANVTKDRDEYRGILDEIRHENTRLRKKELEDGLVGKTV